MRYTVQVNVGVLEVKIDAANAGEAMGKAIEAVEAMTNATENIKLPSKDIYQAYAIEEGE